MKTLRRVVIILVTAVMLLSLAAIPAMACEQGAESHDRFYEIRFALSEMIAESANARIEALVEAAQAQNNPNIQRLIRRTEAISFSAICAINALGFEAECVYVDYEIGGQIVPIDPIIVIRTN